MSRVLVLGNAAVDLTLRMDRLPVQGETVLAARQREDMGGKGLNQAVMARRGGALVRLCAAVGDDPDARTIRDALAAEDIPPSDLVTVGSATDRSLVLLGSGGENMIVTLGEAARALEPEAATAACAWLGPGDILLVQGNLRADTTRAALEQAGRQGARRVANPAPLWFDWMPLLPMLDLAVVNEVEEAQLGGQAPAALVVTRGRYGAELRRDGQRRQVNAPAVEAVDTTGAGDVLVGVLVAGLAQGLGIERALTWGVAAASAKVCRAGTLAAFPTAAELAALRP
jgi:ribokinase